MRQGKPIFKYHISGIPGELTESSPLWQAPLAGNPTLPSSVASCENSDVQHTTAIDETAIPLMIHEYFRAAEQFLTSDQFKKLPVALDQIQQVDIFLEKHGAFYHPARIELSLLHDHDSRKHFVLNCAVSPPGLALIHREYTLLKRLGQQEGSGFIPRVFGEGSLYCRGMELSFFLAEWFDGYKEFHLTDAKRATKNSSPEILHLWTGDGGFIPYTSPDYFKIYEKASEILTLFYNLNTFEQIFPWHHAAGDFIAKPTPEGFDVKLITVRGYASLLASGEEEEEEEENYDRSAEDVNKALLIFFLNLSLRMRIDRRNGIGDYCMVHPDVIPYIFKGFFKALTQKHHHHAPQKGDLSRIVAAYLQQFDHTGLYAILGMITNVENSKHPEMAFIKENLDSHSRFLSQTIHKTGKKCFFIDKAS